MPPVGWPEVNSLPNKSVDFWSLGVLIYEMLIGDTPFTGEDEDDMAYAILNHPLQYPAWLNRDA